MRVVLRFEVEVDEGGLQDYYRQYPGFLEEEETPAETLIREAIANWDFEGLLLPFGEGVIATTLEEALT